MAKKKGLQKRHVLREQIHVLLEKLGKKNSHRVPVRRAE